MSFKQSLIDNNSICLQATVNDWQEAIKIGTDLLVASGAVTADYYHAIIDNIRKMGPYIILAPGLAMPHARPEDGVNRTAFALVTLKEPVYFEGEEEPVDVLVTLAGSSSNAHLDGLMEVTQAFEDEESETGINLTHFRGCHSEEDVYLAIDKALAKI